MVEDGDTTTHLHASEKSDVHECGSYPTLDEVLKALCSKYGLKVRKARTRLTNFRRDAKLSLTKHVTEVKKLVEVL